VHIDGSLPNNLGREPLRASFDEPHRHFALPDLDSNDRAHARPQKLPRPLIRQFPDFFLALVAQSLFRLAIFQEHADVQLDRPSFEDDCQHGENLNLRKAPADAAAVAVGERYVGAFGRAEEVGSCVRALVWTGSADFSSSEASLLLFSSMSQRSGRKSLRSSSEVCGQNLGLRCAPGVLREMKLSSGIV
jgi:hypothetical protein